MKIFKTLVAILIISLSLSTFAQTLQMSNIVIEKSQDNYLFIKSIPAVEDFFNRLFNPNRDELRNRPGNTQSV